MRAVRKALSRGGMVVVVTGVLLATLVGTFSTVVHASCAGPEIAVKKHLVIGQSVQVHGKNWTGECHDTIVCSTGCLGNRCSGGGPDAPATGIALVLVPADLTSEVRNHVLADGIDASEQLSFDVTVTIPDVPPGRYRLLGTSAETQGLGDWFTVDVSTR